MICSDRYHLNGQTDWFSIPMSIIWLTFRGPEVQFLAGSQFFLSSLCVMLLNYATILTLFSTNEVKNIVNTGYTAASVNIQHSLAGRDSKGCKWGTDKSESSDDNDKSTTLSVLWSVLAFQLPPWGANQKSIYTTPLTFTWKCLLLFSNYSQFFILNSLFSIL